MNEIWDARCKWTLVGLQLDFKKSDLDAIDKSTNNRSVDDCFVEMLTKWLQRGDPRAPSTWSALIAALKGPTVDLQDLANKVERKFLHSSSNVSNTAGSDPAKETTGEYIPSLLVI